MHPNSESLRRLEKRRQPSEVTPEDLSHFLSAGFLQHVTFPGEPRPYYLIFISARSGDAPRVRETLLADLPEHSSLRIVPGVDNVDFILTGPLPIAEYFRKIEKSSDINGAVAKVVTPIGRFRWCEIKGQGERPRKHPIPASEEMIEVLSRDGQDLSKVRLILQYPVAPILTCIASIRISEESRVFWQLLQDPDHAQLLRPIRDVYSAGMGWAKEKLPGNTRLRKNDLDFTFYVMCEFEWLNVDAEGNLVLRDALAAAMAWRDDVAEQLGGVERVSLMPCSVVKEGHDYYNSFEAFREEVQGLRDLFELPVSTGKAQPADEAIRFPMSTICICGRAGQGKSFVAYGVACALKNANDLDFDVVYVHYKKRPELRGPTDRPAATRDADEFRQTVRALCKSELRLVPPENLKAEITAAKSKDIYYTEGRADVPTQVIIDNLKAARSTTGRKMLVLFDELLLDEDARDQNVQPLLAVYRGDRSTGFFVGIIAQTLGQFVNHRGAKELLENSSVLVVGEMEPTDSGAFVSLMERKDPKSLGDDALGPKTVSESSFKGQTAFLLRGYEASGPGSRSPYPFRAWNPFIALEPEKPIFWDKTPASVP